MLRSTPNFERLVQEEIVAEEDLCLFDFASDPEDAWKHLQRYVLTRAPHGSQNAPSGTTRARADNED